MINRKKNILVSVWLASTSGRRILAQILNMVNSNLPWKIRLITEPDLLTRHEIKRAIDEQFDGFIGFIKDPAAATALAHSLLPAVIMNYAPPVLQTRTNRIVTISDNDEEIGKTAASHYLSLGKFASYAFVPDAESHGWSRLRERGFRRRLRLEGIEPIIFHPNTEELKDWIASIPKPAAILAAYDFLARDVIDACHDIRLNVPKDVAVIGVDDDEDLCESSSPTISSIRIDHAKAAQDSARLLERLMSNRHPQPSRNVILNVMSSLRERGSTAPTTNSAHLVARALRFIDQNAAQGITAADVIAHLGVSARLAYLRFKEGTRQTIHKAIELRRLKEATRLLEKTNLKIEKIAHLSGYKNDLRLKYVFKSHYGKTMSEWRQSVRNRGNSEPGSL